MAQLRSSRWWGGLTTVLAVAFIGVVYFVGFWSPTRGAGAGPDAAPSVSAGGGPSAAPTGPVSAPDSAIPLTAGILESIGPGWILTTYNSSTGRFLTAAERSGNVSAAPAPGAGDRAWDQPGTRKIYVVDRVGTVYEGADLGVASGLNPRLWLPDGRTLVVARPQEGDGTRVVLYAFDILTGELSAPFDGPGVAESFASRTPPPSVSPSAEPSLTAAPAPVVTQPVDTSPVWTGGIVRLTASGDALLVRDGRESSQWVRLTLDGRALGQAIPVITAGEVVENPNGAFYAASELVTVTGERWNEELLEWIPYSEQYWHTVTYAETPTGDGKTDRIDHGNPSSEGRCDPASWAQGRQLLETCRREDGSIALYTVAPATDTFVRAAVFPTTLATPFFSIKPDASRVATGRSVYTIVGEVAWTLPDSQASPTGLAWSGDALVLWGDTAETLAPGYGADSIHVYDGFEGRPIYTLAARSGEAGFGPALSAS